MQSKSKIGEPTALAKSLMKLTLAVVLSGVLVTGAYMYVNRPKNPPVQVTPTTQVAPLGATSQAVVVPQESVRAETPQAQPGVAPVQQPSSGSDDPYSSLSTKGKP